MQVPYWSVFRALGGVHLEASRVLRVRQRSGQLLFDLVVLISPSHPVYRGPRDGDDHDRRAARLRLVADRVDAVLTPEAKADGAQLGTITSWLVDDDGWSEITGSWGTARVFRPTVTLTFEPPDGG
ncbi:hypothetical protein acdb102_21170 [Acidothermaceae bacterium B102]|nr:hypothetical protein acdb102_21170 [Acidothermaceae bacterium B102]